MDALLAAPVGALLIFLLRILDVSMSIMRMLLAVRGHRGVAAVIGFLEVLLWLVAVGTALEHLDSWGHIVGYAGGFAAGNYVGVWLEGRFAMGTNVVRAVLPEVEHASGGTAGAAAAHALRESGYAVTEMHGRGRESAVEILNVVVPRKRVGEVMGIVRSHASKAFVTVEEVRSAHGGHMRPGGRKTPFLVGG